MESEDIVDKEIESWKGLNTLYEKRIGLNKMLSNKEEYADCMSSRGENFSRGFVYDSHL